MPWWFYAAAVFWSIVPAVILVGVPWAFIAEWRHERWRMRMEADAERRLSASGLFAPFDVGDHPEPRPLADAEAAYWDGQASNPRRP